MALNLRLEFKDAHGRTVNRAVPPRQSVTIGSSNASDLHLFDETDVFARHCEVSAGKSECLIRDLTGGRGKFSINGTETSQAVLANEDRSVIGFNEIKVWISGAPLESESVAGRSRSQVGMVPSAEPNRHDAQDPTTSPRAPRKSSAPEPQHFENGLTRLTIGSDEAASDGFLNALASFSNLYLTVNYRAVDAALPEHEDLDLLVNASTKVRDANSLVLHGPSAIAPLKGLWEGYHDRDVCLLLAPKAPWLERDEFVEKVTPLANWWLAPRQLDFHLREGIEFLIQKMFEPLDWIAYWIADEGWVIVTADAGLQSLADLTPPLPLAKAESKKGPATRP